MSLIRFNVGTDSLTGKKTKYTNEEVRVKDGRPIEFIGAISYHEVNDDPATPPNNTTNGKRAVEKTTFNYQVSGKFIDSTTKLYVVGLADGNGNPIANAISVADYFDLKLTNSFPQVAGISPTWKVVEGWCREMIAILQTNGELNV